jgi:hypothetical protein
MQNTYELDPNIEAMWDKHQTASFFAISVRTLEGRLARGDFFVMPRQGSKGVPYRWATADIREWLATGKHVDKRSRSQSKRGAK